MNYCNMIQLLQVGIIEKAKGHILDFTNINGEEKNKLNWRLR